MTFHSTLLTIYNILWQRVICFFKDWAFVTSIEHFYTDGFPRAFSKWALSNHFLICAATIDMDLSPDPTLVTQYSIILAVYLSGYVTEMGECVACKS